MGAVLNWTVQRISTTELEVVPENHQEIDVNIHASVHVSCAIDACDGCDDLEVNLRKAKKITTRSGINKLHPFSSIRVGQKIQGRILQIRHEDDVKEDREKGTEKSTRIVVLLGTIPTVGSNSDKSRWRRLVQWKGREGIRNNVLYAAVVTSVDKAKCTIAISPYICCSISLMDISSDMAIVTKFRDAVCVGMRLVVAVTSLSSTGSKNFTVSRSVIERVASGSLTCDLSKNVKIDAVGGRAVGAPPKVGDVVQGVVDYRGIAKIHHPPAVAILLGKCLHRKYVLHIIKCSVQLTTSMAVCVLPKWPTLVTGRRISPVCASLPPTAGQPCPRQLTVGSAATASPAPTVLLMRRMEFNLWTAHSMEISCRAKYWRFQRSQRRPLNSPCDHLEWYGMLTLYTCHLLYSLHVSFLSFFQLRFISMCRIKPLARKL